MAADPKHEPDGGEEYGLRAQASLGLWRAHRAWTRLPPSAWRWVLIYALSATLMLGLVALAMALLGDDMRAAAMDYLLPVELHGTADYLARYIFSAQSKWVLANALATGSLALISLALFPIKEALSARFERDAGLTGLPPDEYSLWVQAVEEIKLTAAYVAMFFIVFAIGHSPERWRVILAGILSFGVTAWAWSVDFGAPTLQRHRLAYGQIIKTLLSRPLASLGFGAMAAAPVVLVALALGVLKAGPWVTVAILFSVNIVAILHACVAGTWLGAALLPVAASVEPPSRLTRSATWAVLLGLLTVGGWVTVELSQAINGKSQLLKCSYQVDWAGASFEAPSLAGLLGDRVSVGVTLPMTIHNPTKIDVDVEDLTLEIADKDLVIGAVALAPLSVPAQQTVRQAMDVRLEVKPSTLLGGASLNPLSWRVTLWLQLDGGMHFPIYLVSD